MCAYKSIENLAQTREEYGEVSLLESDMDPNPIEQFARWYEEYALIEPITHNAMVLSTVDSQQYPDSRVVLLKEVTQAEFIFYTHYNSAKGLQIERNPLVALNFYWPKLSRQIRVRGKAHLVSTEQSDAYFHSRPVESQLSSVASHQSQIIANQDALLAAYEAVRNQYRTEMPKRPSTWGGYAVTPQQIEFWQGRNNRLHDRIQYSFVNQQWIIQRLAP